MIKILFICHGNICRSTMSQFVFQHMVNNLGIADHFFIDSMGTSAEESGNPPHIGTIRKLREVGVPVFSHRARQMSRRDYDRFDYIIGMDEWNVKNLNRICGGDPDKKIYKFLTFADSDRDIADPWYTGDFEATYKDVVEGCQGLLAYLKQYKMIF